jgi:hypothetical protein
MALDLTKQEREVLHNRFHAQKHRAKKLGIPFFWDKEKGFTEFLLHLSLIAPSDFSPNRYWVRFDKEIVAEHKAYVPETLRVVPVKSSMAKQKRMNIPGALEGSLRQLSDLAKQALIESQLAIRERDEGGWHDLTVLKDCIDTMYFIANRGDMRTTSARREKLESNALDQLRVSYDELPKEPAG